MSTLERLGHGRRGNARGRGPALAGDSHEGVVIGRPFNLLRSFALLSFVCIAIICIVSGIVILRYVATQMLQREAAMTEQFIQSVIDTAHGGPIAGDTDLAKLAAEGGRVTALLTDLVHIPDVVRANVYAPNTGLVWSTEKKLMGKHFEFNDELERALQGESAIHIGHVDTTQKAEHAFFGDDVSDFIEIYVPIWNLQRSRIIAVAEIYRVPDALFVALAQGRLIVIGGGIVGGLFLYAMLFWIVRHADKVIHEQQQRLENEIGEHKRDKHTLRHSEHALRVLSGKLLGAQEQERKRIAAELHDGLGQSLSAVKFNLESSLKMLEPSANERSIEAMHGAIQKVRDAVEEVRRISMDLRPSILDDLGLLATLEWFCREFQQFYPHISIDKRVTVAEDDVPDILKIVIYRIMQEALNNVAKHAGADRVELTLATDADSLRLSIRDNGEGFHVKQRGNDNGGYKGIGLESMAERAELSGGALRVDSGDGEGTHLEVRWPRRQLRDTGT